MAEGVIQNIQYIVKTPGNLGGAPRIAGHRIGVHDIVNLHIRLDAPLDEIAENYNLTLAEIHAALAYYYDHQDEIHTILWENEEAFAGIPPSAHEDLARWHEKLRVMRADPERELTPPEIAAEFGISEQAVRKAAAEGWIAARKAGKIWLIRRADAVARWGKKDADR
jgi:uncharacterized protein (DUF433 family)